MASEYLLTVTRRDTGERANLIPGGEGERDLIEQVVSRVGAKGVGLLRSTEHVQGVVRESMREVLGSAKAEVDPR